MSYDQGYDSSPQSYPTQRHKMKLFFKGSKSMYFLHDGCSYNKFYLGHCSTFIYSIQCMYHQQVPLQICVSISTRTTTNESRSHLGSCILRLNELVPSAPRYIFILCFYFQMNLNKCINFSWGCKISKASVGFFCYAFFSHQPEYNSRIGISRTYYVLSYVFLFKQKVNKYIRVVDVFYDFLNVLKK